MIVIPDAYSGDSTLQKYVTFKQANGYNVEVARISHVLSNFTYNNNQAYLKISSVTGIQSDGIVSILWYDGIYFQTFATNYNGFNKVGVSSIPQIPIIWNYKAIDPGNHASYVQLTYDSGSTITIPLNNYYADFGLHYILSNGATYTYCGPEMAIHDYAVQEQANYVLLIGNINVIPSFQMMAVDSLCQSFYTGVTDRPYSYSNLNAVTNAPDISVGRIPVESAQQMDVYLNKVMVFIPHQNNRALVDVGNGIFPDPVTGVRNFVSEMTLAIQTSYPQEAIDSAYVPGYDAMTAYLNSGYDNIIIYAHGYYQEIDDLYISQIAQIAMPASSIIFGLGCQTSDFSRMGRVSTDQCLGEAFINDPDSQLDAFIGGTMIMYTDETAITAYYANIKNFDTLGATFTYALSLDVIPQQRFAWELFGDPTLIVSDVPTLGLQGIWSVNNIPVTDPSATLYFNTTTLTFKFVKVLGTVDSNINCIVTENGLTIATLAYQGSSTWVGTVNFSGGRHVLVLKASDGTNVVTMTINGS